MGADCNGGWQPLPFVHGWKIANGGSKNRCEDDPKYTGINEAEEMRVTPWIAANFSIEQALWTCNPATFENPYRFITLFVLQPYYLHNPIPPYKKVREVLEQAGATSNPADAKEVWLGFCKSSAADVKAKVKESTDMQQTLQEIALAELNARLSKTQKSGK